ncbi:MAG: hypothetical protein MJA30_11255 [Cytophagales bacterium]|nr:hypothetical protein [Cytophagales bacterium]
MRGRSFILLASLFFGSILSITLLFEFTANQPVLKHGFSRAIPVPSFDKQTVLNLKSNSYYFAGASEGAIYLGHGKVGTHILEADLLLERKIELTIVVPDSMRNRLSRIAVHNDIFYFADKGKGYVWKGLLNKPRIQPFFSQQLSLLDLVPIHNNALAVRAINQELQESRLSKISPSSSANLKEQPELLEKQIDGVFCTDGSLVYNPDMNVLVYLYYYRNQFIVMDTSLNLLYRGNTIDTTSQVQIQVAEVESQDMSTMSAPPLLVNKRMAVSNQRLFVHSNLLSQNEEETQFKKSAVIDMYDLAKDGAYISSFYVPNYKGYRLREFKIEGEYLVALHHQYLITYKLGPDQVGSPLSAFHIEE